MSVPFDAQRGLVIVGATVDGPSGTAVLRLALDTGATRTVMNAGMLVALGYDPALVPERIQITTGSGVEFVPRVPVQKLVLWGKSAPTFRSSAIRYRPVQALTGCWDWIFCVGKR